MSTASYPRVTQPGEATRRNRAAERARARRDRRQLRATSSRMSDAGRPVRSALSRVPFVVALIVVLTVGVGGVLYLNTKTDESGMRTEQAKATVAQLRLTIEELTRTAADLSATPRLAAEAEALGLVPAGDAAIVTVDDKGAATLLGAAPADGTAR
jgi:cell division protein FtsL